ncbi:hypothetical protein NK8_71240 (plasmid) [Caballeronia sp. NK8]|nr:hypothetical protein NK8_71240 [Caballeronia sp. NK8]
MASRLLTEKRTRVDPGTLRVLDARSRIEPANPGDERIDGIGRNEIGLVDDDAVREYHLLPRDIVMKLSPRVHRIDHGDDRFQLHALAHVGIGEKGL